MVEMIMRMMNTNMDLHSLTRSSVGNGSMAMTVRGALIAIIPVLLSIGQTFDLAFTETEIMLAVDSFTAVLAGAMILFGLARKVYHWWLE